MFNFILSKLSYLTDKFIKEEKGAETLEYIGIASVIILLGVAAYNNGSISGIITQGLTAISGAITAAQTPAG